MDYNNINNYNSILEQIFTANQQIVTRATIIDITELSEEENIPFGFARTSSPQNTRIDPITQPNTPARSPTPLSNLFETKDSPKSKKGTLPTMIKPTYQRKPIVPRPIEELLYASKEKDYIKGCLMKYRVPDLKVFAKSRKLPVSGVKYILADRITDYFLSMGHARTIQRRFRGWMVRYFMKLRGDKETRNDRSRCVNDTDFVTLEPLSEIPDAQFYSYMDAKGFIYGFDILSLYKLLSKKERIVNPYNREQLSRAHRKAIRSVYTISSILKLIDHTVQECETIIPAEPVPTETRHITANLAPIISQYTFCQLTNDSRERYRRLLYMRTLPIETRIRNLFIEFDQVGNYTQSSWFASLGRRGYYLLYRCLYDLWTYRAQLTREVRNRICPFFFPLFPINTIEFNQRLYNNELTLHEIREVCVICFENIIYGGIDEDHRQLAAFHLLSALTVASIPARQAMPWLYESLL
jgi:hypothetical protein